MRIATWNVNSVRSRVGRIVDWLVREDIDVLAMQEIKCTQAQFPIDEFGGAGYEVQLHGLNQWNGVAIASRSPIEARAIGATISGVRVWSLYVPNGRALGDPHYDYKLDWLAALAGSTKGWMDAHPDSPIALTGDFNIAPLDSDVGDPTFLAGVSTHISEPERTAFRQFETLGLTDVVRSLVPEGFTFWDYKQLRFPRNEGMRIDFVLGNHAFADRVVAASIHRDERKGDAPSDHVPVAVDLDLDVDDDDRPMIF
jgi:exodeoxyribonuclease-3